MIATAALAVAAVGAQRACDATTCMALERQLRNSAAERVGLLAPPAR